MEVESLEKAGMHLPSDLLQHLLLFQKQGWPIGCGMVESANKLVVEARLKGRGCIGNAKTSTPCWLCVTGSASLGVTLEKTRSTTDTKLRSVVPIAGTFA